MLRRNKLAQQSLSRRTNPLVSSKLYLGAMLSDKRYRLTLLVSAVVYFVIYLFSIGNFVYLPGANLAGEAQIPSASFTADWAVRTWKQSVAFVWEPVGTAYLAKDFQILLSIPNYLIGALLSILIGLNVSVAVDSFVLRRTLIAKAGSNSSFKGMLGSIPSFFTGFGCCAPSFLVALGPLAASATLAIIEIRPFFIPAAILAMSFVLVWNTRKTHGVCELKPNAQTIAPKII